MVKTYMNIKNPKFRKITRNRDNKGRILTYSVILSGVRFEFNTLAEAKRHAIKI